jgi:membrane protease YdiL (CAAX protease family)
VFLAAGVGIAIVAATGVEAASNQAGELAIDNPELVLVLVPLSILLIGPGEELLFRGVVQGTLRRRFGPVVSVGLASAIFASVHFVALTGGVGGRLVTIGVLFLPSLVFGALYEHTENLVVNALVHGAYNATLFTLVYVAFELGNAPTP